MRSSNLVWERLLWADLCRRTCPGEVGFGAHERLFAAARDPRRISVIVMLYGIGCVRGGGRVIHRSAGDGANGRIAQDICPSALPGNGKGPPKAEDAEGLIFLRESAGEHIVCAARIIVGPRIFLTSGATAANSISWTSQDQTAHSVRASKEIIGALRSHPKLAPPLLQWERWRPPAGRGQIYPVGPFRSATGECDDCTAMGPDP